MTAWSKVSQVEAGHFDAETAYASVDRHRIADNKPLALSPALQVALAVSVVGVIVIGVYPQPLIELAQRLLPSL